jgi:hypothetical protein
MADLPIRRVNTTVPARDLRNSDIVMSARDAVFLREAPAHVEDAQVRDTYMTNGQVFVYFADNHTPQADLLLNHSDRVRVRRVEPIPSPFEVVGAVTVTLTEEN